MDAGAGATHEQLPRRAVYSQVHLPLARQSQRRRKYTILIKIYHTEQAADNQWVLLPASWFHPKAIDNAGT